jgi:putative ABC transport system permease protein
LPPERAGRSFPDYGPETCRNRASRNDAHRVGQRRHAKTDVMDRIAQDVRVALRGLRGSPTLTVTVVSTLGLGIGMAVAMWTIFNAVLLTKLPVRDQDAVVVLHAFDQSGVDVVLWPPDLEQLRHETRTMRDVAGFAHWGAFVGPLVDGGRPVVLAAARVTGDFFDVLGARPVLGRLLRSEDDVKGATHVMVVSYGVWQRQFGGDPAVIGHQLTDPMNQFTYTIVGVAPPGLDYPVGTEYWIPTAPISPVLLNVVGRLASNGSIAAARSEFAAYMQRLDRARPDPWHLSRFEASTLSTAVVGRVRPVLVVLTAAVALLLVIACVNVGTLLLLRAAMRSRELAVRAALGASYGAIVRLLFTEGALLAVGGGVLGLACAEAMRRTLIAAAPAQLPRSDMVRIAGLPAAVTVAISLIAALLFGVLPAMVAVRRNPASPLRLDARAGRDSRQRRRMRSGLVAAQVALALVMLSGAGLLGRSLQRLEQVPLGYTPDHLAILELSIPLTKYDSASKAIALYTALAPRLAGLPGVEAVTPVLIPPFLGSSVWAGKWEAEGGTAGPDANPTAQFETGDAQYFRALGIPIRRGRVFLETDRENALPVAVVSEGIARRLWPERDPIGQRLRVIGDSGWRTVVGVAGDIRLRTLRDANLTVYLPYRQFYWQGYIAIRTSGDIATVLPAIRRVVGSVDPGVGLWRARTMDQFLAGPLAQPRMSAFLLSAFGFVALLLSAIGLYGVMASSVREQTHELGVRMALGASPRRLLGNVLRRAMSVSAVGAVVGLAGAMTVSRFARALLFEVSPNDPAALVGACVLLLVVALLAAYVPARFASRVDPARALQAD